MVTPNVKPWITGDDIEAQLQNAQRMDPNGALRWGFDKATSHLHCRQKLYQPLHRAMVDVPRRRRKPG